MATIELKPGWDQGTVRLRSAIVVRLTDHEAAEVRLAAETNGTSVSALMRGLASSFVDQYRGLEAPEPTRERTKK